MLPLILFLGASWVLPTADGRDFRIVLSLSEAGYPYHGDMNGFNGADYYCESPNGVDDRMARALLLGNPSIPSLTEGDMQLEHRFFNLFGKLIFTSSFAELLDEDNLPTPQAAFVDRFGLDARHPIWTGARGLDDQCARNGEPWKFWGKLKTGTSGNSKKPDVWWNESSDDCTSFHQLYCVIPIPGARGDPHFIGFDGCKFDFDGIADNVFAIYSDTRLQLNALFTQISHADSNGNWMTKIGIRFQEFSLVLDPRVGLFLAEEGTLINTPGVLQVNDTNIEMAVDGNLVKYLNVERSFVRIGVDVKRFSSDSDHFFINIDFEIRERPVNPHGVLGQTAKILTETARDNNRNPLPPCSNDGKISPVEGEPEDYIVHDGILGVKFTYSQFAFDDSAGGDSKKMKPRHDMITSSFVAFGRVFFI